MSIDANGRKHESSGASGGQFAVQAKATPSTTLTASRPATVGIMAVATLDTNGLPALPQWPAELGEPTTSYSWDEDGYLEVSVAFGAETLTVWGPIDHASDSFTEVPGERPDIPRNVADQVAAYGYQMHENLASLTGQVEYAAHTPAVRSAVLAAAKGEREPAEQYDPEDPTGATPAQRATTRTEAGLAAWFGEDVHESTLQDVLTDLMHYADAKGIDRDAFEETLRSARFIQGDETENPEG